ncbi:hypothetical protein ACCX84_10625 [Pantoea trifolii]
MEAGKVPWLRSPHYLLAVIVRHLMQHFATPDEASELLQTQQSSGEVLKIKRQADPLVDFCDYLMPIITAIGLFIGNANIYPLNTKRYRSLSCLPVVYGITRPSAPVEP